jgi:hypothetical protein
MLIMTVGSATVPDANARPDADTVLGVHAFFGPGAVVRERSLTGFGSEGSESQTVIAGAPGRAKGAIGPCVVHAVPLTRDRVRALQISTIQNSTARKSTVQRDTNEMTRLYPATRGGVGPHPAREPEPV